MNLLHLIMSFLTTPNETATLFVTLPCSFIENYLSFWLFTRLLKINYTKTQRNIYIIIFPIIGIFSNLFISAPFNVVINYILNFIYFIFYLKLGFLKSIAAIAIPLIVFGLVNSLILKPFLKLFSITANDLANTPIYKLTYLFFVYAIISILILFFKYKKIIFNLKGDIGKKTTYMILANLIFAIIALSVQLFQTYYYINVVPVQVSIFNFVLILAYFLFSFHSLMKAINLDITMKNLENAEHYNKSLTILYDNVKGFKHDFDNVINTMDGFVQAKDYDGLQNYYNSLKDHCMTVKTVELLNPHNINNPGIYNLLVSKYQKACEEDIFMKFDFFIDFSKLNLQLYEFSKILGILLDNAIEAAKECEVKKVVASFRESRKNNVQIITIENTYADKNIDTEKIFEKNYSGKKSHSGIGLWEVRQIVNHNPNVVLNTFKNEKYFVQQLELYDSDALINLSD